MYYLNKNVFVVYGKTHDCIYNLNDGRLYQISKDLSRFISDINIKENFSDADLEWIEKLIDCGILSTSQQKTSIKTVAPKKYFNFAWIEVCDFCNLKCRHCYNESSSSAHNFMSIDSFVYACEQLSAIGIQRIQIIGGEPFCNKDIKRMIEYARNHFSSVEIFTNGTLLDKDWIDFIGRFDNVKLALSVYSYLPEEHDRITSLQGSHNKTMDAIRLIKENNIPYRIATVHMKGCSIGEKNTELFTIDENKDVVRLAGRGCIDLLTPELLKKKLITKKTYAKPLNKFRVLRNMQGNRCFISKLYISCKMDVYPCVMEREVSHGNLNGNSLNDLIKSDLCFLSKDWIKECSECEFRYACEDCRPDRLDGSLYEKPYYCTYDVKSGTWIDEDVFVKDFFEKNT